MRERERERERERKRERERERPNTSNTKIRQKKLPRQFSRLLTPVPSLSVFHGNLPHRKSVCGASSLMFIMGEREKERERERGEREKERERDGESTLQDHIITMR